ncbi:transposase [Shewanella sp. VB17]|uniref:transposase n=1 Tax=Shewanella sp. VB17 TaxID=2739432 RepID=UPI0015678047|nr:transposase [Shewanella sp. VB17]NRD71878.1 transposase [Shewanella sp. VB17]
MTKQKRPTYSAEFKLEAAQLVVDGEHTFLLLFDLMAIHLRRLMMISLALFGLLLAAALVVLSPKNHGSTSSKFLSTLPLPTMGQTYWIIPMF